MLDLILPVVLRLFDAPLSCWAFPVASQAPVFLGIPSLSCRPGMIPAGCRSGSSCLTWSWPVGLSRRRSRVGCAASPPEPLRVIKTYPMDRLGGFLKGVVVPEIGAERFHSAGRRPQGAQDAPFSAPPTYSPPSGFSKTKARLDKEIPTILWDAFNPSALMTCVEQQPQAWQRSDFCRMLSNVSQITFPVLKEGWSRFIRGMSTVMSVSRSSPCGMPELVN